MDIVLPKTTSRRHKKGRKFGRKARRPGHKRYLDERRWLYNKARRIRKNNGEEAWVAFRKAHLLA